MKTNIEKKEQSEVVITVTLPNKDLEGYRLDVEKKFKDNLEIDGFRKGKVPEDIAKKHINNMRVLEEMAHRAISEKYIDILKEHDIKAIGNPNISITKIAEGNDLEFTITTAVLPEIKVADFKKIAKKINAQELDAEVSGEEVDGAILNLRKMRAQQQLSSDAKEGENVPSWNEISEENLPEMTDEWVKEIGPFTTVEDFVTKIKENLLEEKKVRALDKKRIALVDEILAESDIEVPQMMIDYELDKMLHEFEHNISMTGMSFDDYLKSINKTREDYKKEWNDQAKKRAQTQLMLNHIAEVEKIEPTDEEIQQEVKKIMEQYKHNPQINETHVTSYVSSVLSHQKVFEYLESIS